MQFLIGAFINWHVRIWHIYKLGFEDQFLKQTEHINYCDKRQTDISFRCGKTFLSYKNLSKQLHFSWTLCSVMCWSDLKACWTCVQPLLSQWRPMDPILNLIEGSSRGNFCQCWWLSESFLISEVIVGSKYCQTCGREAGPKPRTLATIYSIFCEFSEERKTADILTTGRNEQVDKNRRAAHSKALKLKLATKHLPWVWSCSVEVRFEA